MRHWTLFSALALILVASCSAESSRDDPFVARDSGGVTIATSRAPSWDQEAGWMIDEESSLQIGGEEGDPAYSFFRVVGAVRLDDGTLIVADGGSLELRFFTAQGTHIRSVGRQGAGPGEFMSLAGLKRRGDTAVAYDVRAGVLRSYAGNGDVIGETRIMTSSRSMDEIHFLADGAIAARAPLRAGDQLPPEDGYARSRLRVEILDSTGKQIRTLGPFEDAETYSTSMEQGGVTYVANPPIPFGRRAVFAGAEATVFVGSADSYQISGYRLTGEHQTEIRYDTPPVSVGDEQIDAFARRRSASAPDPEQEYREVVQRVREHGGSVVPPYARMLIDADGYLWLGSYPLETSVPRLWHVFERSGRLLGLVRTPEILRVLEIGHDYLLGVIADDMGVERVYVYSLIRS